MAIFWEHIKGTTDGAENHDTFIKFTNISDLGKKDAYPTIKANNINLGQIVTTEGDNQFINKALTISELVTANKGIKGTTGTFSGAVSGTTGTFSGAVSGTTGTFSSTGSFKTSLKRDGNEVALQKDLTTEINERKEADNTINTKIKTLDTQIVTLHVDIAYDTLLYIWYIKTDYPDSEFVTATASEFGKFYKYAYWAEGSSYGNYGGSQGSQSYRFKKIVPKSDTISCQVDGIDEEPWINIPYSKLTKTMGFEKNPRKIL